MTVENGIGYNYHPDQDTHSNIQSHVQPMNYAPAAPENAHRSSNELHPHKTNSTKHRTSSPATNKTDAVDGHEPLSDPFNNKPLSSCTSTGLIYDGIRNMRLNPVAIPDLKLQWHKAPRNVLLVKKHDPDNIHRIQAMIQWLTTKRQITVYVESDAVHELHNVTEFNVEQHRKLIDFCITIGGDGTVLQLSALFTGPWNVPPVMSFMGGTLGFLTSFEFDDHQRLIDQVLNSTAHNNQANNNSVTVCPRMRLLCTVYRQLEPGTKPVAYKSFQPLNEMLLGRGSSPFLTIVDMFLARQHDEHLNDELIGTVLADGVLVSSATGSTAYSMAAGGPMVSPSAPAMLVTPVCPHSLSFRPIILPDVSKLSLRVSCRSRSSAVAAFDGRGQVELAPGDYVHVQMSPWPVPSINISNQTAESLWFKAITHKLHWNAGNGANEPPPLGSTKTLSLEAGCQNCKAKQQDKPDKEHERAPNKRPPSSVSSPSRRLVSHSDHPENDTFVLHGDAVSHHNSDEDTQHDDKNEIQVTAGDRVNMVQRNSTSAQNLRQNVEKPDNCASRIEQLAAQGNEDEEVVTGASVLMRERTDLNTDNNSNTPSINHRQQSSGNSKL